MLETSILSFEAAISKLRERPRPYAAGYRAMYSSYLDGIVTDPALMIVPIDDHVVHRGDGVFEAMKFVDRQVYGLDRHLARLERSAELAQLTLPVSFSDLRAVCLETARASGQSHGLIRLYLTRGPGGFSANPYESIGAQVYVVITDPSDPPDAKRISGVSCRTSAIPIKPGWFANVKSCNYLPNALMKKEAVDANVDFTLSLDERGFLAEGSTENCAIVSDKGELVTPRFARVLRGITCVRALELARGISEFTGAREADISAADVSAAREMLLFGTTMDVLPVTSFNGLAIGSGLPGPGYELLLRALHVDQRRQGGEMTAAF